MSIMSAYFATIFIATSTLAACLFLLMKNKRRARTLERDLRLAEEKFTKVFRSSPDWVTLSLLEDGIYLDVNDAFCRDTGYSREDIIGRSSLEFGLWPDPGLRKAMVDELRAAGSLKDRELELRTRSGEIRNILRSAELITIDGKPCIISVNKDITERKTAQDSISRSEERYRSLFEESKDAVFVSTPEGQFLDINPAGVELFGYESKEELLNVKIAGELYLDRQHRLNFQRLMERDGFLKDYEIDMKKKGGEKITVLVSSTLVRNTAGQAVAYRGILKDISDRKLLEAQLRQAQKMEAVGQLAGGIAHDFNNILTTIIGYADLLKGRFRDGDSALHYINELLESAERASMLTRSLLAFSRKQVLNITTVDINDVLRKVEHLLSRIIGEDIELRTEYYPKKLNVMADPAQLEQVLMNLATNARDAMPDGGSLTIRTDLQDIDTQFTEIHKCGSPGSCAAILVSDSGTGMDAGIREKIFDPFFTTKEVGKGTGLGLAMAYGIVKQHNGYIDVSSRPNHGSTFRILLPLTAENAASETPGLSVTDKAGGEQPISDKTVLLAEDSDSVRKLSRIVLEKAGLKIIEAVDGEDAIAKFVQHRDDIDLVVLDIIMPRKNGRQVYEEIRKIKPGVKVLLTSGYTSDVLKEKGFDDAMPDMLFKPVSPRELLRKTMDILETNS